MSNFETSLTCKNGIILCPKTVRESLLFLFLLFLYMLVYDLCSYKTKWCYNVQWGNKTRYFIKNSQSFSARGKNRNNLAAKLHQPGIRKYQPQMWAGKHSFRMYYQRIWEIFVFELNIKCYIKLLVLTVKINYMRGFLI